jgi:hypothetical protein
MPVSFPQIYGRFSQTGANNGSASLIFHFERFCTISCKAPKKAKINKDNRRQIEQFWE